MATLARHHSLQGITSHLYWIAKRRTFLVGQRKQLPPTKYLFSSDTPGLNFSNRPVYTKTICCDFCGFHETVGKKPPTKYEDPTLYCLLGPVNDAHNFLIYETLSMPGTYLLLHVLHCRCSGFPFTFICEKYLVWLINTQCREGKG